MGAERQHMVALLDRIIAAAEAGDPSDSSNIYAPDAVIWHNHNDKTQTVQQNMRMLVGIAKYDDNRRYLDRRIAVFNGGIVQQRRLVGTRRSTGEQIELNACVVHRVEDGRITRLDEYIDQAQAMRFGP